jgi:hypothetical protein
LCNVSEIIDLVVDVDLHQGLGVRQAKSITCCGEPWVRRFLQEHMADQDVVVGAGD